MSCPRSRERYQGGLALLLAFLVLFTVLVTVGAHHDHDSGHHAGCPSCRLAEGSAGAMPVLDTESVVILVARAIRPAAVETTPAAIPVFAAHRLRAPPVPALS